MKSWTPYVLVLLLFGCSAERYDVSLSEIRRYDDAPVALSELVEAVTPASMSDEPLRALLVPFAMRQDIAVRRDVGREMADIFRLAWLERKVCEVLEYDPSRPWPGLAAALSQARAKGANILITGNVSQFFEGGGTGRTSIGVTVEIHWVPDGTLIWSAAQAAAMESAPDQDFAIIRDRRRLPEHPTYAVMRALSASMAQGFSRHLGK
jgi:hypothetical protein